MQQDLNLLADFILVTLPLQLENKKPFWLQEVTKYWKLTEVLCLDYQAGRQQLRAEMSGLHGNIWETPWPGDKWSQKINITLPQQKHNC